MAAAGDGGVLLRPRTHRLHAHGIVVNICGCETFWSMFWELGKAGKPWNLALEPGKAGNLKKTYAKRMQNL